MSDAVLSPRSKLSPSICKPVDFVDDIDDTKVVLLDPIILEMRSMDGVANRASLR
jgi:hypothetical protein